MNIVINNLMIMGGTPCSLLIDSSIFGQMGMGIDEVSPPPPPIIFLDLDRVVSIKCILHAVPRQIY